MTGTAVKQAHITSMHIGQLEDKIVEHILGFLDYDSLRQAEKVSHQWKDIILKGELWIKLYHWNLEGLPEWGQMEYVLQVKSEVYPKSFPVKDSEFYHKNVCCTIGDTIEKLKRNWKNGLSFNTSFNLESPASLKKKPEADFFLDERWIVRAKPNGRIGMRSRWALEEEHEAELLPNKNVPIDNDDLHPTILSVQSTENRIFAIGQAGNRKLILFFSFQQRKPPLLKLVAWRKIDSPVYEYNLKNCFRVNQHALVLCGTKVSDKSTVVTVINPKDKVDVYKNQEIPARFGTLFDFAVDELYVVFFFGKSENSRSKQIDRYCVHVRSSKTFDFMCSFTLPIIKSDSAHFYYSNGLVFTGSECSPILIWNVETGRCDGRFNHGGSLVSLKVVAEKLILTCDRRGLVKVWDLNAALNEMNWDAEPDRLLIKTLAAPSTSVRQVRVLDMQADACTVVMSVQYDAKFLKLLVMDFLSGGENLDARPNRKRRRYL